MQEQNKTEEPENQPSDSTLPEGTTEDEKSSTTGDEKTKTSPKKSKSKKEVKTNTTKKKKKKKTLTSSNSDMNPESAPVVKQTLSSLLREEAVYTRKQEKEKIALSKYEMELRDEREFQRWKDKMDFHEQNSHRNQMDNPHIY